MVTLQFGLQLWCGNSGICSNFTILLAINFDHDWNICNLLRWSCTEIAVKPQVVYTVTGDFKSPSRQQDNHELDRKGKSKILSETDEKLLTIAQIWGNVRKY
jgi:hypothetical protein